MILDIEHLRRTLQSQVSRPRPGQPRFGPDALVHLDYCLANLENLIDLLHPSETEQPAACPSR